MAVSDAESLLHDDADSLSLGSPSSEHDDTDSLSLGSPSSDGAKSVLGGCEEVNMTVREGIYDVGMPSSSQLHDGVSSCPGSFPSLGATRGCSVKPVWSEATVLALSSAQKECIRQNASLTASAAFKVGSDCSGSDAVWEALGHLTARWDSMLRCHCHFQKEFCSEHPGKEGNTPRSFLFLNSKPRVMFRDMCDRKSTGFCSISHGRVAVPRVDLYSAGWVCRDDSNARFVNRRPVTVSLSDSAGDSTRTLHSSMDYIRSARPSIAILENTVKKSNIRVAVTLLHQIPRYAVVVFKANSRSFNTCASRPRMYIVAINLDSITITTPLSTWASILSSMSSGMPTAEMKNCLLPDDHPHVRQFLQELKGALVDRGWGKCKKLHERSRQAFYRKYDVRLPGVQGLRETILSMPGHKDLSVLTPRQLDIYGLHLQAAKIVLGTRLEKHDMVIDVTNNITLAACKHLGRSGTSPCLLRTHQYIHTGRARPICGTERMLMQGFSRPLILAGTDSEGKRVQISQRDLCSLAGDTMSVPVMGGLLAVVFSCCLFKPPPSPVSVEDAEEGVLLDGTWVGKDPSGRRGLSTVVDQLPMDSSHSSRRSSSDAESLL